MNLRNVSMLSSTLIVVFLMMGCAGEPHIYERGGINATDHLNRLLDRTTMIVGDVFNVESANAALPELININEEFDKLIEISGELSDEGRQVLAEKAARAMPGLKGNARRINGQRGIGDVLGKEINKTVFKLTELL
jgi:hypothetical protein